MVGNASHRRQFHDNLVIPIKQSNLVRRSEALSVGSRRYSHLQDLADAQDARRLARLANRKWKEKQENWKRKTKKGGKYDVIRKGRGCQ